MRKLGWTIGLVILSLQLGAIVYARFVDARYFCWAPYDMQTDYRISVWVNGEKLKPKEIRERYRRPAKGTDNRSYQHVIDIIEGAERRYHSQDEVKVILTYRVNGKQEQKWIYRQP